MRVWPEEPSLSSPRPCHRKPPPPACRTRFPQVRELRPDYAGPGITTSVTARQRPVNPASGEHPIPRETRPETHSDHAPYPCCPRRANPDPATAPPIRARSGITSIAEVPENPHSKVLHLCRYPEKCCTICDRHRERCWHRAGRRSW